MWHVNPPSTQISSSSAFKSRSREMCLGRLYSIDDLVVSVAAKTLIVLNLNSQRPIQQFLELPDDGIL